MRLDVMDRHWAAAARRREAGEPVWRWFDYRIAGHAEALGAPLGRNIESELASDVLWSALESAGVNPGRHLYLRFAGASVSDAWFWSNLQRMGDLARRYADTEWAIQAPLKSIQVSLPVADPVFLRGAVDLTLDIKKRFLTTPDTLITVEAIADLVDEQMLDWVQELEAQRVVLNIGTFEDEWRRRLGYRGSAEGAFNALLMAGVLNLDVLQAHLAVGHGGMDAEITKQDFELLREAECSGVSWWSHSVDASQCRRQACCLGGQYSAYSCLREQLGQMGWLRHRVWQAFSSDAIGAVREGSPGVSDDLLAIGPMTAGRVGDVGYLNVTDAVDELHDAANEESADDRLLAVRMDERAKAAHRLITLTTSGALRDGAVVDDVETAAVIERFVELDLVEPNPTGSLRLTEAGRFWSHNMTAYLMTTVREAPRRERFA